jgi:hypothetical protein
MIEKKSGVGGFSKILRNIKTGLWQIITFAYKVGGWGKKRPKICLRNTWMVPYVTWIKFIQGVPNPFKGKHMFHSYLKFGYIFFFFLNGLVNNIPYLWLISERWTWRSQSFILHFFLDFLTLKKICVLQNSRLMVKGMCNETNFVINITLCCSSSGAFNQAWWYFF